MSDSIKQFVNIKVVGVGGGGTNAVNRMIASGVKDVEFWSVNTDVQSLNVSLADHKLQIGSKLTKGLGAGANADEGRAAAEESREDISLALEGSDMIFLTCGLGGGTGTGASPVIAEIAKQTGSLTVAVVTKPFRFEGPIRMRQAEEGLLSLKDKVDALIVIPNDKLLQVVPKGTTLVDSFKIADDVLKQGVKGIAELITTNAMINLDFADVRRIMSNSGSAMMGIGIGSGDNRAVKAAEMAISSPLLEESIDGATGAILNVTGGPSLTLHEVEEAAEVIYNAVDPNANIIFGADIDQNMKDEIQVTVIAAGFKGNKKANFRVATRNQSVDLDGFLPLTDAGQINQGTTNNGVEKKNDTQSSSFERYTFNSPVAEKKAEVPADNKNRFSPWKNTSQAIPSNEKVVDLNRGRVKPAELEIEDEFEVPAFIRNRG
ncbi:MAG: cell division protein FtsZ [Candidatus Margulisiibacteriota bacterium]|jgi:cell division protein FtsZ